MIEMTEESAISDKKVHEGWKTFRCDRSEKKADLLKSGKYSDVKFVFYNGGKETTIKAHGLFLAEASDVFEAMMYGDFAREEKITITDIRFDTFLLMLQFIYGDYIYINSINVALDLYSAADKYIIPDLVKTCIAYLECHLQTDCVFNVYEFAVLHEIADLKIAAMDYCKNNVESVIESETLFSASVDTLITFFRQSPFEDIDEIILLDAVLAYAEAQTDRRKEVDLRMNEIFKSMRFIELSVADYAEWMSEHMNALKSFGELHFLKLFANLYYRNEHNVDLFVEDIGCKVKDEALIEKSSVTKKHESYVVFRQKSYDICDYIYNINGNLFSSTHFQIEGFNKIVGVEISTQLSQKVISKLEIKNIKTYVENLNIELLEYGDSSPVLSSKHFVGVVPCDDSVWIDFDKPVKLQPNQWYKLVVKFNKIGCYARYSKQVEMNIEFIKNENEKCSVKFEDNGEVDGFIDFSLILGLKFQ